MSLVSDSSNRGSISTAGSARDRDRPTTGGYGLMEGTLTSDPKEKKKHFILEEIDMHLEHLKEEERHSLCNGFWFFAMIFTVLAGVMCILIGLSQTVIFQQYPRNWELFGAG